MVGLVWSKGRLEILAAWRLVLSKSIVAAEVHSENLTQSKVDAAWLLLLGDILQVGHQLTSDDFESQSRAGFTAK